MKMKATWIRILLLASAFAALGSGEALAQLRPEQVLVVANARSPESVALARTYLRLRKIDPEQLVLVKTTTQMTVSREDYDAQIAHPIRKALIERELRDQIRCICLIYGVPVKVEGPRRPAGGTEEVWRSIVAESHRRLAQQAGRLEKLSDLLARLKTQDLSQLRALLADSLEPLMDLPAVEKLRQQLPGYFDLASKRIQALPAGTFKTLARKAYSGVVSKVVGLEGLLQRATDLAPQVRRATSEELARLRESILELRSEEDTQDNARKVAAMIARARGLAGLNAYAVDLLSADPSDMSDACVDSELALLWMDDYDLSRWQENPLHWKHAKKDKPDSAPALMTARLDGPGAPDVLRMLKASVETEEVGLRGKMYIDAGGMPQARSYDKQLIALAEFLDQKDALSVRLDTRREVFAKASAPDAGLYVGWYSLQNYVPAFLWNKGAVGWHISSFEARDLRKPQSRSWCVKMIQNGVAATIGAVDEPYLSAFPSPQEFFSLLLTGKATLAQCYWRCIPHASWRMTLLGDPLYNPYKAAPRLRPADLPKGLLD